MSITIITFVLVILGAVAFKLLNQSYNHINVRKAYVIFNCIILGIESGFRHLGTGPDTYSYFLWFNELKYESWSTIFSKFPDTYMYFKSKDPGYSVLVKVFQLFSTNFQVFLVIIAIFYFSALGLFIFRNTNNLKEVLFAFILYIALFQIIALSGIRQQITTAISLFAFDLIQKKKFSKFIFLVLIGSTIHISLLLITPLYFLNRLTPKNVKYIYYIVVAAVPLIIIYAHNIAIALARLSQNEYYMAYTQSKSGGAWTYVTFSILVTLSGLLSLKRVNHNNKAFYIAIALMTIFAPLITINGGLVRVGQYFSLYMMCFIPLVIRDLRINFKVKRIIFFVLIVLLISMSIPNSIEYNFFWEDIVIHTKYIR